MKQTALLREPQSISPQFEPNAHIVLSEGDVNTLLMSIPDGFVQLDAVRVPSKYPGKRHFKGRNKGNPSGNPLGKNPFDV